MTTGFSITTLVIFICSIAFVIHPLSIPIRLPYIGQKRAVLNLTTAPILAIALLFAMGLLALVRVFAIFPQSPGLCQQIDGVKPYNILILFFSLAYMAITLDITGVLQAAAFWVSNKGGSNGWKLYLYFYLMLTVLSVFLGNDPVILSGTAFLVYYTKVSELNPISWLISEFAAANTASMVLFVGNPTNVVICEGFEVNNAAFTAYTILPFLACNLACFAALAVQFRNPKYLRRRLNNSADLDVRSVLLDPKGAWVGAALLGSCLVVIIIVSFFHVDVWKISLPFALAKFIFDLAWDHYRFMHQIPMLGHAPRQRAVSQDGCDAVGEAAGDGEDIMLQAFKRRATVPAAGEEPTQNLNNAAAKELTTATLTPTTTPPPKISISPSSSVLHLKSLSLAFANKRTKLAAHFPTFFTALPRLPFALIPFAFSQFILIEALAHQGWIDVFASWLRHATHRNPASPYPTIWIIGILGIIFVQPLWNQYRLLTKVVRAAVLPPHTQRAAAISLAVSSNIGAVGFTFSASLAGLLWRGILKQKGIFIGQRTFAFWNTLPLVVMGVVGLGVVCAEMAILR
ncbi:CitMHS domain-containing protein [Mycena venus]|uniref:CitMHS domain-containing protein n=1 Tax=Mycena venus TaxID=2733690 RepID=A0A8H7DE91_9AGAR|nr:CitMHS domain-containing protein [Mycena venus]